MKTFVIAAILGLGLIVQPAQAKDLSTLWTTISESAPRSIFDEIRDSAPRSAVTGDFVGELQEVFETLRDRAP